MGRGWVLRRRLYFLLLLVKLGRDGVQTRVKVGRMVGSILEIILTVMALQIRMGDKKLLKSFVVFINVRTTG